MVTRVVNAVANAFFAAYYFVYFLFKGNEEWKCDKDPRPTGQVCCVSDGPLRNRKPAPAYTNDVPKSFVPSHAGLRGFFERQFHNLARGAQNVVQYLKNNTGKVWNLLKKGLVYIWTLILCVLAFIKALFVNNIPSETLPLPATPKPFKANSADSPSYNKVNFDPKEKAFEEIEEKTIIEEPPKVPPQPMPREKPIYNYEPKEEGDSFYSEKVFAQEPVREKSVPPPPPPPLPPPKPAVRPTTPARATTPGRATPGRQTPRKEVKGGIGGFNADIMDELEETQKARQERAISAQREMTQSCHPDMAQWKQNDDYELTRSGRSTPWRAQSVGPRVEEVVSRLNDGDHQEANFVFRAKKPDGYTMGGSVFSPVEEAEQYRHQYNQSMTQQQQQEDRSRGTHKRGQQPNEPRSRTVGPVDYGGYGNPYRGSSAYRKSPFTSHTARPAAQPTSNPFEMRGTDGVVSSTARQWPPISNATGATFPPAQSDDLLRRVRDEQLDSNGLITTMCRRVIEKKRNDNWKWHDDSGKLVDEKNTDCWKGELDTMMRDGPNQGRHWNRTVEKKPSGLIRFQDINRQYNNDFVVESIVRNY